MILLALIALQFGRGARGTLLQTAATSSSADTAWAKRRSVSTSRTPGRDPMKVWGLGFTCNRKDLPFRVRHYGFYIQFLEKAGLFGYRV